MSGGPRCCLITCLKVIIGSVAPYLCAQHGRGHLPTAAHGAGQPRACCSVKSARCPSFLATCRRAPIRKRTYAAVKPGHATHPAHTAAPGGMWARRRLAPLAALVLAVLWAATTQQAAAEAGAARKLKQQAKAAPGNIPGSGGGDATRPINSTGGGQQLPTPASSGSGADAAPASAAAGAGDSGAGPGLLPLVNSSTNGTEQYASKSIQGGAEGMQLPRAAPGVPGAASADSSASAPAGAVEAGVSATALPPNSSGAAAANASAQASPEPLAAAGAAMPHPQAAAQPAVSNAGAAQPAAGAGGALAAGLTMGQTLPQTLSPPSSQERAAPQMVAGAAAVRALTSPAALSAAAAAAGWSVATLRERLDVDPSLHYVPSTGRLVYACSFGHDHAEPSAGGVAAAAATVVGTSRPAASPPRPPWLARAAAGSGLVSAADITPPAEADPSPDQALNLHSRPGAPKVIYLHFKGQVTGGTDWQRQNNQDVIRSPAFDIGEASRIRNRACLESMVNSQV